MTNSPTGHDASHLAGNDSTHEPGDQQGKSETTKTLDSPLADEDVNTKEQRNQGWTSQEPSDPRRYNEGEPLRQQDSSPAPTVDRPQGLKDKLDDVQAHPHSDAQDTTDTQGEPGPLGGMPKTGSGEQDPMRQAGGGQHGG